ncbi:MAG: hypothetical protein V4469_01545 [Patescibacteria group bacterium]
MADNDAQLPKKPTAEKVEVKTVLSQPAWPPPPPSPPQESSITPLQADYKGYGAGAWPGFP